MSSYRFIDNTITALLPKQTISGVMPVQSMALQTSSMGSAAFQFNYSAGLTATLQILASLDGVSFFDTLTVIAPIAGSAGCCGCNIEVGGYKYLLAQVTPSAGSGTVTVLSFAKTRA